MTNKNNNNPSFSSPSPSDSHNEWFPITDQETIYLSKDFEFTSSQVMTEFFIELLSVSHDTKYCLCADKTKDSKSVPGVSVAIRSTESAIILDDSDTMTPEVSQLVKSVENLYSKKCNSVKRPKKQK
jgi:hypothetical protein